MRLQNSIFAAALLAAGLAISPATAADLPGAPPALPPRAENFCPPQGVSEVATLPSLGAMQTEIYSRYVESAAESESERTIFNRSPRLDWAYAARGACGIALGYLSTGEVNPVRLWNCECYHARMISYFHAGAR